MRSAASSGDGRARVVVAGRLAVLAAALLGMVGVADHYLGGRIGGAGSVWLTATLGPTGYVLLTHPRSASARLRNAVLGHGAGIGAGLVALAVFGLWSAPSVTQTQRESLPQVGAQAFALALTVAVLTLLDTHHAPAAATALLIASGITRPGPPLAGLVLGLLIVIAVGSLLTRVPVLREQTGCEYQDRVGDP